MPILEPYKFPCGCILPVTNGHYKIDFERINYDCPKTWDIYCEGQTQSIFQLEKYLGKMWSKKCKPRNIEDAGALIAAIRPGCLNSFDKDGNSMTELYSQSKTGKLKIENIPVVEKILKNTHSIMLYQEQMMFLARDLAGWDGPAQNKLRKAAGKKDSNLMNSMRPDFVSGCLKVGLVDEKQANFVFDQMSASGRYLFNACISPLSYVDTESGPKTLDELIIGEKVNSPNGFIEVLDKFETGEKEVVEIELEDGKKTVCTLDHKFKCEDGVVRELWEIIQDNLSIITENE